MSHRNQKLVSSDFTVWAWGTRDQQLGVCVKSLPCWGERKKLPGIFKYTGKLLLSFVRKWSSEVSFDGKKNLWKCLRIFQSMVKPWSVLDPLPALLTWKIMVRRAHILWYFCKPRMKTWQGLSRSLALTGDCTLWTGLGWVPGTSYMLKVLSSQVSDRGRGGGRGGSLQKDWFGVFLFLSDCHRDLKYLLKFQIQDFGLFIFW